MVCVQHSKTIGNAFPLGHSTKQNVESWNKQIKECTKAFRTVCRVPRDALQYAPRAWIDWKLLASYTSCFFDIPIVYNFKLMQEIERLGISKYAADQLAGEISIAETMTFERRNPVNLSFKICREAAGNNKRDCTVHVQYRKFQRCNRL